ncbi:MAG: MarR family winged helix-turn-helix transcriptional regulator [Defluviitaleaceae bacterium]|nr:MarR family winged helix-turn-helix transcriptional regulator [Defluviitaleaceae bacterium]
MEQAQLEEARNKFKETWHRLDILFNQYARACGLNFTSMMVLDFIYYAHISQKPYTQKEICDKLNLPKQLVNIVIKTFWQQGYVELKEAKDRRIKHILLTPKGQNYAAKIINAIDAAEDKAWECFADDDIINLVNGMEKYEKSFEQAICNIQRGGEK